MPSLVTALLTHIQQHEQLSVVAWIGTFLNLVYLTLKLLNGKIGYLLTACTRHILVAITTQA
jgi:hypothetical protein